MFVELAYHLNPETVPHEDAIEAPRVIVRSRMDDGKRNNTSYIEMFVHTGTHVDMPWHFNNQGKKVNDFEIGDFVFHRVKLLDIPKNGWEPVELADLEKHAADLADCDALLIRTGFGAAARQSDPQTYIHATPGLSPEAADYLASFKDLRCIGVDFISIENLKNHRPLNYPVHHSLLDRAEPMFIIEDANLDPLPDQPIHRLYLFPLRIEDLEASPVTPVAEII